MLVAGIGASMVTEATQKPSLRWLRSSLSSCQTRAVSNSQGNTLPSCQIKVLVQFMWCSIKTRREHQWGNKSSLIPTPSIHVLSRMRMG